MFACPMTYAPITKAIILDGCLQMQEMWTRSGYEQEFVEKASEALSGSESPLPGHLVSLSDQTIRRTRENPQLVGVDTARIFAPDASLPH